MKKVNNMKNNNKNIKILCNKLAYKQAFSSNKLHNKERNGENIKHEKMHM